MSLNPIARLLSPRRGRRSIAVSVLCALLWTQLALAAHACPMLSQGPASGVATNDDCHRTALALDDSARGGRGDDAAVDVGSGFSDGNDPDQTGLCFEHCRQGDQKADQSQPPPIAQAPAIHFLVADPSRPTLALSAFASERLLARALSPPKAIAHCCFRI